MINENTSINTIASVNLQQFVGTEDKMLGIHSY